MYQVVKIDSQFPIDKVLEFCNYSKKDTLPGAENLDTDDWESKTHTLLYLIYKEKRYDNFGSGYIGLEFNGKLISGAGYYPLDIDKNIVNVNSRYYTIPEHRSKLFQGNYILPAIFSEIADIYKIALFGFNDYNLWLRNLLLRINHGKAAWLGKKTPIVYKGWLELKDPIIIKNTTQYCLYKIFDSNYEKIFLKNITQIQAVNKIS